MNVEKIIKKYLKENGYDGLYNDEGECACLINDLAPCEHLSLQCKPGIKAPAPYDSNARWIIWPGATNE